MWVPGLVMLLSGCGVLTWCAAGLGLANPGQRLPGSLPTVEHPAGYMPVGMLGLLLVFVGALVTRGAADGWAWLIISGVISVGLGLPFAVHNHRLP